MISTMKGTQLDAETCAGDALRLPLLYDGLSESLRGALECFDAQQEARGRALLVSARLIALQLLLSLNRCTDADERGGVLCRLAEP